MTEHPEAEVVRAVHEVFADPAYVDEARAVEVGDETLRWLAALRRLYDELARWIRDLFSGGASWISYVVAGVLAALIAWGLVRLVHALARARRVELPPPEDVAQAGEPVSSRRLYARAHALAGEGRWSEALRHLMLVLVAHLRSDARLRWSDAWTNHELAARVALPAGHHAGLDRLVDSVDRAWYGNGEATDGEFREGCALVARVTGFPEQGP